MTTRTFVFAEDRFDACTIAVGDRVDYLEIDEQPDARSWGDAERQLRERSLCLHDDGGGYVVAWRYAADGSYLDHPVVGDQPK